MHKQKNISDIREIINTSLTEGLASNTFSCAGIGFSNGIDRIITDTGTCIPLSDKKTSFATLYDIASLQKPMVAVIALQLIEAGSIDLEERIADSFGATGKDWDKVTIRHLLTNSIKLEIKEKLHFLTPDIVRRKIFCAGVEKLGDGFYYHNTTAIILGWFLENLLQRKIGEILKIELFKKASMKNTFWSSEIPTERMSDVVPSEICSFRGALKGDPQDELAAMYVSHGYKTSCAGIFSTASDLVRFGEYVVNNAFVDRERIHQMMLRNYLEPFGGTFGLGFDVPRPEYLGETYAKNTLYHTGFSGGAIHIQPLLGNVMVSLTNTTYPVRSDRGPGSPIYQWRQKLSHNVFG